MELKLNIEVNLIFRYKCNSGSFASVTGLVSCSLCAVNTFAGSEGSNGWSTCSNGEFAPIGSVTWFTCSAVSFIYSKEPLRSLSHIIFDPLKP